jgi:hypothetical protein
VLDAVGEPDHGKRGVNALGALLAVQFGEQQRQFDVLRRGQHRHQIIELEDEADIGGAPGGEFALGETIDALVGHRNLAGVGAIDAAEQIEQRGLARTGRPHDRDEIAAGDRKVEMIEDRDRFLALGETLGYAGKANHRLFGCHACLLRDSGWKLVRG